MSDLVPIETVIVNADADAAVSGPCWVVSVIQGTNTSSTDTTYELHDALTVTGGVKIFSRTTSLPMVQNFPWPGVKFSTGISVNKTNGGDSKIQIAYHR